MSKTRLIPVIIVFLLIFLNSSLQAIESVSAEFKTFMEFPRGEKSGQLMWIPTDNGGVLDGPFQGPMAFLTDKNGNLWVGDTLNGRILAFDAKGIQRKEIDLIALGKKAGLASDPVLLDLIPGINGKLLVADAANNAVLEIDVRGGAPVVFRSSSSGKGFWSQINRIHCDKKGRIFIEDLPLMNTVVINNVGRPAKEPLEGEVGISVNSLGQAAMVVLDTELQSVRHIVISPRAGNPAEKFASFSAKEPIVWASIIGFDARDRLYVVFDTASIRHYVAINPSGEIVSHKTVAFPDPNYDPGRPDWVGADGKIFSVKIDGERLKILHLE